MSRYKLLAFLSFSFFSSISLAEQSVPAGDVNTIYFYLMHTGVLVQHTTMIDPDACGRKDFYILPDTHPHFKEVYSLLLATQMASKKVSFTISGCHQGIPAITHVALAKQ
jgi:hypothetical protein